MSVLRHPVVITPLEEDFKRIGLIQEEEEPASTDAADENFDDDYDEDDEEVQEARGYQNVAPKDIPRSGQIVGKSGSGSPGKNRRSGGSGSSLKMGYKAGGDRLHKQSGTRKDPSIDYGTTEDDDWDEEPVSEAQVFSEGFEEEWEALSEAGAEEIVLDEDDMEELESMGRQVAQQEGSHLYVSYMSEREDADEDEDIDEGGMYSSKKAGAYGKKKEKGGAYAKKKEGGAYESIADAMNAIEALYQESPESLEDAVPAFANIALISEMLANFFQETGQIQEDEDFDEISQAFAEMAKNAAGAVEVISEDDPDSIDTDRVQEMFGDYLETLLGGLEMYSEIAESGDGDIDEDDEDDLDEGGMKAGKKAYGKKKEKGGAYGAEDEEDDEGNE